MNIEIIGSCEEIIIESMSNLMNHFDIDNFEINYKSTKMINMDKYSMVGNLDSLTELREYNDYLKNNYDVQIYVT
jgi:hypothetical protein